MVLKVVSSIYINFINTICFVGISDTPKEYIVKCIMYMFFPTLITPTVLQETWFGRLFTYLFILYD